MICHGHGSATDNGLRVPWWRSRSSMVLCGFLLVAGFHLLTEHTAHVYGVLPYLLLSCPLMHLSCIRVMAGITTAAVKPREASSDPRIR